MIDVYSTNVTSTTGMTVPFNTKSIQRGYSVIQSNSTQFVLNYPGVYEVNLSAYGSTTADGSFGFELLGDSNVIERATTVSETTAGNNTAVSMSVLIGVNMASASSQAVLTVQYVGGAGTIELVNMTVKRVSA